jgi:hypothetical protein
MVKIGKYNYEKSNRKNKKLFTIVNGKEVHFGDIRYKHFTDKTKIHSNLDHKDPERRKNYLKRSKGIKDKNGNLSWMNPSSPNYHAVRILW